MAHGWKGWVGAGASALALMVTPAFAQGDQPASSGQGTHDTSGTGGTGNMGEQGSPNSPEQQMNKGEQDINKGEQELNKGKKKAKDLQKTPDQMNENATPPSGSDMPSTGGSNNPTP